MEISIWLNENLNTMDVYNVSRLHHCSIACIAYNTTQHTRPSKPTSNGADDASTATAAVAVAIAIVITTDGWLRGE